MTASASPAAGIGAGVTFTTPHTGRTSGGVYVIRQLARHAARRVPVTLVSQRRAPRPAKGMRAVRSPSLAEDDLPDAGVLVVHADVDRWRHVRDLGGSKGARVLLLQGYDATRREDVMATLRDADRAVAVSGWLAAQARRAGCATRLVRPGLDRAVFRPGPPAGDRRAVVAFLAHPARWKAAGDGLAALRLVRDRTPGARVVVLGSPPAGCEFETVVDPTRRQVGALLREAAVLVHASHREGLGLPGIEALACRAALATTDSRGSRDYAVDGETALVVPPGDVDALAGATVRLLQDRPLRRRLADAGHAHVLARYPPWPRAADRFLDALADLTGGHLSEG